MKDESNSFFEKELVKSTNISKATLAVTVLAVVLILVVLMYSKSIKADTEQCVDIISSFDFSELVS